MRVRSTHVLRKPLGESSVAANTLKHGCGGLNIDATRLPSGGEHARPPIMRQSTPAGDEREGASLGQFRPGQGSVPTNHPGGRWPANLILEHHPDCRCVGERQIPGHKGYPNGPGGKCTPQHGWGVRRSAEVRPGAWQGHADPDGMETLPVWECCRGASGCPVAGLDEQSGDIPSQGQRKNPTSKMGGVRSITVDFISTKKMRVEYLNQKGGASRFFKQVQAKEGSTHMNNGIPEDLVSYLHALIAPTHLADCQVLYIPDIMDFLWKDIPDASLHGMILQTPPGGDVTPWEDDIWRVLRPGAHLLLISPEDQPTGHTGACILEDKGFEVRDAILLVQEAGALHYVPKPAQKERHSGCEMLARQGEVQYDIKEDVPEDDVEALREALVAASIPEDQIDPIIEGDLGIGESKIPEGMKGLFEKQDVNATRGNRHPCLHPDALVMTDQGYRPISEIKVGDFVYSADGCFSPVENVSRHPYTSPNLYEIAILGTSYKTLASDNHPFLTWRPSRSKKGSIKGGEVAFRQADQIQKGDYTMTPMLRGHPQAKDFVGDRPTEFWFLFGLYLAEGSLLRSGHGHYAYPAFALHQDETDLVDRIRQFCLPKTTSVYPRPPGKGIQVVAFDNEIGDLFPMLGGTGASTKVLHPIVWTLDAPRRQAILDGYLAGDGGRVRGQHRAKTVSPDMASQLMLLGHSLGYTVGMFRYEAQPGKIGDRIFKNTLPFYQLYFGEKNGNLHQGVGRKPSRPLYLEYEGVLYSLHYVKAVTPIPYVGEVVNLTVKGSPTFQTAVGMSHNTCKPKAIMERLLADVPLDAVVLDPFLGSGSTGLACLQTGHDFIGIEKEAEYLQIAEARVRYWDRMRVGDGATIVSEASPVEVKQEEEDMSDFFGL